MAKIPTKRFVILLNGIRHQIRLPQYYDSVSTPLGLQAWNEEADKDLPGVGEPTSLLTDGRAVKVRTSRKVGRRYYFTDFIISVNNLNQAMSGLEGKNFGTTGTTSGEIIKAYFPKRRRLG